jgi:ribosomal-protein-alanine N-acetyltransferase
MSSFAGAGLAPSPKIIADPARDALCRTLTALQSGSSASRWEAASFAEILGGKGAFVVLASLDAAGANEAPQGFALGRVAANEGELLALGVDPKVQGKGLGRRLVSASLALAGGLGATQFFLEVAEDNARAIELYRRHGFRQVGRRPHYYRSDLGAKPALVLRRALGRRV